MRLQRTPAIRRKSRFTILEWKNNTNNISHINYVAYRNNLNN